MTRCRSTGPHSRRPESQEHGAAAVEFALVLLPLMVLVLGAIQFSWYFFTAQSASSAARETARRIVVGECTTQATAESFATAQARVNALSLEFGSPSTPTSNDVPDVGDTIRVTVRANGKIMDFLPLPNNGQVTRIVDARVENDPKDPPTC